VFGGKLNAQNEREAFNTILETLKNAGGEIILARFGIIIVKGNIPEFIKNEVLETGKRFNIEVKIIK
jgi:hypothetical protein